MQSTKNIDRDAQIKLDIAVGKHRRDKAWKNKTTTWDALKKRLSETHRTAETHAEYLNASPDRQAEIKDVGGFVGGHMISGRRKKNSCDRRSLITLDADAANTDLWEVFTMLCGCAALVYSTHKHSPDKPRLRVVIPLARPVSAEEYEPICRKIAEDLGINQFDHTGYQVERLMYWPSTSSDGEFYFQSQDGEFLNPDEVLARYVDWTDATEWPLCDTEKEVVKRGIKKQGDPLEKPGIVGAFNRARDIHETIAEYLPDVYEQTAQDNRYTYKLGSTAAGLVIYEDKFAYSHHGTDPTCGKLCNAFDLVRLHLFGLKDEDAKADTPVNRLPSFLALSELCAKDPLVKKQIIDEKLEAAAADFADEADTEAGTEGIYGTNADEIEIDPNWTEKLSVHHKTREIHSTINNVLLILENDPMFKQAVAFDAFENRAVFKRQIPWRKITHQTRYATDADLYNIEHRIETLYQIKGLGPRLVKAFEIEFRNNAFHPVRDYLEGLTWDGEPRAETLLVDYLGANDNEYTRAVTRKTLAAAVKRIFNPGIKFDYVLTLVGEQGKKKSSLIAKLAGDWFNDTFSFHMLKSKQAYEQLQGAWIIEIGELSGMAKAEIEAIKSFVSATTDRYRSAYGRMTESHPRQCIFFATTNKIDFLRDQTGNRRFWPVMINPERVTKDVFTDLNDYEVGQYWAEALEIFKNGETLYLDPDLEDEARAVQEHHTETHPWAQIISAYLEIKLPEKWRKLTVYERRSYLQDSEEIRLNGTQHRDRVCLMEIWDECLNQRNTIDEKSANTIRSIMRKMKGWQETDKPVKFGHYGLLRKGFIKTSQLAVTNRLQN